MKIDVKEIKTIKIDWKGEPRMILYYSDDVELMKIKTEKLKENTEKV